MRDYRVVGRVKPSAQMKHARFTAENYIKEHMSLGEINASDHFSNTQIPAIAVQYT